jgi:hypothetical protein
MLHGSVGANYTPPYIPRAQYLHYRRFASVLLRIRFFALYASIETCRPVEFSEPAVDM